MYVSAQIDITGKTFESFLGLNYYSGIFIGFGIVVVYIFSGGFLAVAWSDFFQGFLMFIALVFPAVVYLKLPSGVSVLNELTNIDPGLINVWGAGGARGNVASVVGLVSIGIGYMGSPQVYVRFIAISSENEIKKGKWVAVVYTLTTDSAAVMIGLLGRYVLTSSGQDVEIVLGVSGENVCIAGNCYARGYYRFILRRFITVMSTVDSLLVVASSAITIDFYQQLFKQKTHEQQLIIFSKKTTLVLATLALSIALVVSLLSPNRTVFWFVIFGWSGIAATFCPAIILSLFWDNYTEKGAIASMISGFLSVPIFKFIFTNISGLGVYFEKLDVMLPSVLVSLFCGYAAVIIDKIKHSSP